MPRPAFGRTSAVSALLLAVLLVLGVGPAQGGAGNLDPSFGKGGWVKFGARGFAAALALQADGKIVVASNDPSCAEAAACTFALARYQPNGSLDPAFGSGGTVTSSQILRFGALAVVLQADGKIVVAGGSTNSSGTDGLTLVRYNPDGSLDPSFGTGGTVFLSTGGAKEADGLAIQPDGKIVAVGWGALPNSYSLLTVARFIPDGSLDPSFGSDGVVTTGDALGGGAADSVAIQTDGKLDVGGEIGGLGAIVRYNPDGSLDPTFGSNGVASFNPPNSVSSLVLQSNGEIIASGFDSDGDDTTGFGGFFVSRFQPDGSPDLSFHRAVVRRSSGGLALQPDGKIVVTLDRFGVVRLTANGFIDPTFGVKGFAFAPRFPAGFTGAVAFGAVLVQADGKIVVAGTGDIGTTSEQVLVARFLGGQNSCTVPKVVGKRLPRAERAIRRAYCTVGKVTRVLSSRVERGNVVAQKPKAGTRRPFDAKVTLVVSEGERR